MVIPAFLISLLIIIMTHSIIQNTCSKKKKKKLERTEVKQNLHNAGQDRNKKK